MNKIQQAPLTVIVPNFNHGHLIRDCIVALQAQDFKDFKVRIIDDNSTDNSVEMISGLIKGDSRFNLFILEQNIGLINLQNMVLETVESKYVYLAAADDYILPGFFSKLITVLERHPDIGFASSKSLIPRDDGTYLVRPIFYPSQDVSVFEKDKAALQLLKSDFLYITGASLIRTKLFKSIGILDSRLGAFADGIHMRRLAAIYGYAFVNQFGLIWRRSKDSFSVSDMSDKFQLNVKLNAARELIVKSENLGVNYADKYYSRMQFMSRINGFSNVVSWSNPFMRKAKGLRKGIYFIFVYLKYRPFGLSNLTRLIFAQKTISKF